MKGRKLKIERCSESIMSKQKVFQPRYYTALHQLSYNELPTLENWIQQG
jgi:hypothetical protein